MIWLRVYIAFAFKASLAPISAAAEYGDNRISWRIRTGVDRNDVARLDNRICKSGSPLMNCYQMTQGRCLEFSLRVTRECVAQVDALKNLKRSNFTDLENSSPDASVTGRATECLAKKIWARHTRLQQPSKTA
jgi:hypothetical protein